MPRIPELTQSQQTTKAPNTDDYADRLAAYFENIHALTGRFDQKSITPQFPTPQGMTEEDALMIVVNMEASALEDPSLTASILPSTSSGTYAPSGTGAPWCEFENAAMIREMSLIARQGVDRSVRRNLFANMSRVLNYKYGIDRSEASCKNQWYRELRARSKIDERACFGTAKEAARLGESLRVSLNSKSKVKAKGRHQSKTRTKAKVIKEDMEDLQTAMVH
jgi:hypothetical protein